jgi:aspartyl-tRNA(Asn)/glutamyl-tRNA(Gln) amidotransferase subunit A
MDDYSKLSAAQIAAGLKKKEFSAAEICKSALERAENKGRSLNAFVTITDEMAIGQAESIDCKIAAGQPLGMMAGVPVAIKDNICLTGYPTTCGSHILENFKPPYNATCTERLIKADAVIIGKTNMDEFAMGSSNENSYFGPVKNPIGENLVPGGSSGGSAAVVAADIAPITFGSETGGSVRQPAAFCGIYGLKPSYGAVSRYGLVAFASSMDQIGPMARNVEDLTRAYSAICGRDENDSTSVAFNHPDYLSLQRDKRKFKFGLPKEYFQKGVEPEIEKAIDGAIKLLQKDGHEVIEISLPHSPLAIAVYYIIADAEASSNLARYDGIRYGFREEDDELFKMYCKTRRRGFGAEVKRRIIMGTYVLSAGYYDAYYFKAQKVRELIRLDFEKNFEKVDLMLTPTTPTAAFKIGEKSADPLAMYLSDIFTAPANLAGIPALSIPCGIVSDGRPAGLQLIAPAFGELALFQAASRLEELGK